MERKHEDKGLHASIETKTDEGEIAELRQQLAELKAQFADRMGGGGVDVTECPLRWEHKKFQGRVCDGCRTAIPSGGVYTPAEMRMFFPSGLPRETPKDSVHGYETDAEKERGAEIERARVETEDAIFAVAKLQRDRSTIQRGAIINGQEVDLSESAYRETRRLDAAIVAAQEHAEELRKDETRLRVDKDRLGRVRMGKMFADLHIGEAAPEPPTPAEPGLGSRILSTLRGDRT